MKDTLEEDLGRILIPATEFLQHQLSKTNVLVHCFAGVSRSASVVLAYLVACHSFTLQKAYDVVKTRRPEIKPNRNFVHTLLLFEQHIATVSTQKRSLEESETRSSSRSPGRQ